MNSSKDGRSVLDGAQKKTLWDWMEKNREALEELPHKKVAKEANLALSGNGLEVSVGNIIGGRKVLRWKLLRDAPVPAVPKPGNENKRIAALESEVDHLKDKLDKTNHELVRIRHTNGLFYRLHGITPPGPDADIEKWTAEQLELIPKQ
jgi:hypothetical protein